MQLLIAAGVGVGLIFAGLGLARYDRRYASYLPAVRIIVLYLRREPSGVGPKTK